MGFYSGCLFCLKNSGRKKRENFRKAAGGRFKKRLIQNHSSWRCTPHTFIGVYVFRHHIFTANQVYEKNNPCHKIIPVYKEAILWVFIKELIFQKFLCTNKRIEFKKLLFLMDDTLIIVWCLPKLKNPMK